MQGVRRRLGVLQVHRLGQVGHDIRRALHARRNFAEALQLVQNEPARQLQQVGQKVQPAAVRHADDDIRGAGAVSRTKQGVHQHKHAFQPLQGVALEGGLLAEEVVVKRLAFGKRLQNVLLGLPRYRSLPGRNGLKLLAQPLLLFIRAHTEVSADVFPVAFVEVLNNLFQSCFRLSRNVHDAVQGEFGGLVCQTVLSRVKARIHRTRAGAGLQGIEVRFIVCGALVVLHKPHKVGVVASVLFQGRELVLSGLKAGLHSRGEASSRKWRTAHRQEGAAAEGKRGSGAKGTQHCVQAGAGRRKQNVGSQRTQRGGVRESTR
mmetsp:Transcript_12424/g.31504  ORF Transcript_12424/g.31504 Transcript_12424/m.31504 type:complete len:319 (-) Transcript_12424:44-1000(-)